MKTIKLYGELGRTFGKVHRYDIASPAEAVRALVATVDGFGEYLANNREQGYKVIVGTAPIEDRKELVFGTSKEVIKIVPVMSGAGKGLGEVLLGAALLAAAFVTYNPELATGAWGIASSAGAEGTLVAYMGGGAFVGTMAASLGASLVLGGIAQMLSKTQAPGPSSTVFNGAVNTTNQGNPVPICYGHLIVGSQVISAGLDAENTP